MSVKKTLSHIDKKGKPAMVNVGEKPVTARKAMAQAMVRLPADVLKVLKKNDLHVAKGSLIQTAIIAGIMGAKKTSELIPLCHPLGLDNVNISIELKKELLIINCETNVSAKTGVEMEALTGASVAALTIYDMCKGISHDIVIESIKLISKSGGKRNVGG